MFAIEELPRRSEQRNSGLIISGIVDPALPASRTFFKWIATWLTAWSGLPAGVFAPSLAIGASLGHDIALSLNYPDAPTLIALGMVGCLAAATQAPPTSFIVVMEMVGGHALVLSLMACALVSSGVSRVLTRPLYATLALLQRRRLSPLSGLMAAPKYGLAGPGQEPHRNGTDPAAPQIRRLRADLAESAPPWALHGPSTCWCTRADHRRGASDLRPAVARRWHRLWEAWWQAGAETAWGVCLA